MVCVKRSENHLSIPGQVFLPKENPVIQKMRRVFKIFADFISSCLDSLRRLMRKPLQAYPIDKPLKDELGKIIVPFLKEFKEGNISNNLETYRQEVIKLLTNSKVANPELGLKHPIFKAVLTDQLNGLQMSIWKRENSFLFRLNP